MVIPCLNFNVDVIKCFSELRKCCGQPKTEIQNTEKEIQKMKKEMEKLKAKRNDIKNKIEEARGENRLASDEVMQWQRYLELMEGEVAAILVNSTRINSRDNYNIKLGPWGILALGDSSFDTGRCISQITRIAVYSRSAVHSLEVSYVVDRKNVETTTRLGAKGGLPHSTFNLQNDEYIDTMAGLIDEYRGHRCISQLKFKTKSGKILGPFGTGPHDKEGSKEFTVPIADYGQIVGFFGYYDNYLKAIGVYVAPIN